MSSADAALRIVSGGQTGVDRAALDVALARGMDCGGWVPRGRRAEDGRLAAAYPVRETLYPHYADRTRRNVRNSDGTLVLVRGEPSGGTALTLGIARRMRRPCRLVDLNAEPDPAAVRDWLADAAIRVLNVAGPRESSQPGIYAQAAAFFQAVLDSGGHEPVMPRRSGTTSA